MTDFQTIYNFASGLALLFVALIWSSKVGLNILIKSVFGALAFAAAILIARGFGL